jgi:hypothetical protein
MQSFSSPFDFSSPFGINEPSNLLFASSTTNNHTFADVTKKNSVVVTNPPSYDSVCNGTSRSVMDNQSTTRQASRNPPPGLVHPSQNEHKMINIAILQALRNELTDAKKQLVSISQITQKIENIEKILIIFEKMQ